MPKSLTIDRMELADTGSPIKLAELLISQLQSQLEPLLPIPIEQVATACGITEIHEFPGDGFEGGLIQNDEKTLGYILVKEGTRQDRRRFTVAHELGHFLHPLHVAPEGVDRLLCTTEFMKSQGAFDDPRLEIEAQANEFAANVLMPERPLRKISKLWGSPQVQAIIDLQSICNVSKEAAARRFLDLHGDPCAVVFSLDGKIRYSLARGGFPRLEIAKGQAVPRNSLCANFIGTPDTISAQEESDSFWWLNDRDAPRWQLWEEVLIQQSGYRMTLLVAEETSYEEDRELEKSWTPRFRK